MSNYSVDAGFGAAASNDANDVDEEIKTHHGGHDVTSAGPAGTNASPTAAGVGKSERTRDGGDCWGDVDDEIEDQVYFEDEDRGGEKGASAGVSD